MDNWDWEEFDDRVALWKKWQSGDNFLGIRLGTELWFRNDDEKEACKRLFETMSKLERIARGDR